MKKALFLSLAAGLVFSGMTAAMAQKIAIYSYPVEIELTSDQGDMPTKDYLKNYGTKGKKRGVEFVYEAVTPFLVKRLELAGYSVLKPDTLAFVKANEYGMPSATVSKAVATGIAEQYIRVYLKDITLPEVEGLTQQDANSQKRKLVKMRCRIQVYDSNKKLIREGEGVFQSGEKIEHPSELGVDLRKYEGTEYLQELKIYETCTKVAIMKAIQSMQG